jgi:hypothetical protein
MTGSRQRIAFKKAGLSGLFRAQAATLLIALSPAVVAEPPTNVRVVVPTGATGYI